MSKAESGDLVAIYADESCIGNGREGDNPGGAGGLIEWLHPRSNELTRCDYWSPTSHQNPYGSPLVRGLRSISKSGILSCVFTAFEVHS